MHGIDPVLQIVVQFDNRIDADMTKSAASLPDFTRETPRPQEEYTSMHLALKQPACAEAPIVTEPHVATSWVDRDIRDFLAGKNDGGELLHALYDHILDEPVPERLRAVLKR
jgi:hypothetical protein